MTDSHPPKVFISHASEDKERFVTDFSRRLTQNGIDVWLDSWSMHPGDDLVKMVFEEGIGKSKIVIIVLSSISVEKPWVREELNVSFIQKIQGKAKIIPVVIEECEIPICLQSTVQVRVVDTTKPEDSIQKVLSAIYGVSQKPQLGNPPRHLRLQIEQVPGVSLLDNKIFKLACEISLSNEGKWVEPETLKALLAKNQIPESEASESIEILKDRGLIEYVHPGIGLPHIAITNHGFENYGKLYITNFDHLFKKIMLTILNDEYDTIGPISDHLSQQPFIVEFMLDILAARGFLEVAKFFGDIRENVHVTNVTAKGRRYANNST